MITSLLRLLQLCSQTLPVGAYAYSQAQEYAIATDVVNDAASAELWIMGVFTDGLGRLDLPALALAYRAVENKNWTALDDLNEYLQASRETRELLLEDISNQVAVEKVVLGDWKST